MTLIASLALTAALATAQSADDQRFSFVVLGHLRGDANGELLQNLDEVLSEVERLHPDLVFLCGDLIWGDIEAKSTDAAAIRADWDALDRKLARLSMPVHRVPGNHDVNDLVTRDIWVERYGDLPKSFEFEGSKFLLLRSVWWPEDGSTQKHPDAFIRGKNLAQDQLAFLDHELAEPARYQHVFAFTHHLLWWDEDAGWWKKVHPKLLAGGVDAVFGGDYGPLKFSAQERDGVKYLQTSIENVISLEMLRTRELSRQLSAQFDNFVLVEVDGESVRYDVRTVGALSTGKFTPDRFRAVNEFDKDTFARKLFKRFSTPDRLVRNLTIAVVASFLGGIAVAALYSRLRRRGSRA
ncbi:MAG: metallophosphoesterase [Planctomycetes bacterium]|nr:metallophosphoesterase [Planctomycetota bacterium]